jgi:prevent-host-death family protein
MDAPVTALRAHLADRLNRVSSGEEVVITDRRLPVARLVGLDSTPLIEQLCQEGLIGRAADSSRVRATAAPRVRASTLVSEHVSAQRR